MKLTGPLRAALVIFAASATTLTACGGSPSAQEEYPSQRITILTHSEAGSGGDLFARPFAELLSEQLGVDVQVENRPGGMTASAMEALSRAKPDGYTLMALNDSYITTPLATPDAGYDAVDDLEVICRVLVESTVIVVRGDSEFATFEQLMNDLDTNTQRWGVQGFTTGDGVLVQQIADDYSKRIESIPYDDGAGVSSAILAGDIVATVAGLNEVDALVRAGDLKVLATTTSERLTGDYADVPTLIESGIEIGFDKHRGLAGPVGLPDEVVERISEATQAVLATPEYQELLETQLSIPAFQDAATYTEFWAGLDALYEPILTPGP